MPPRCIKQFSKLSPNPTEYWIGLNDRQTEGQFVWDDGAGGGGPTDFYVWSIGPDQQPDDIEMSRLRHSDQ